MSSGDSWMQWQFWMIMTGCRLAGCSTLQGRPQLMPDWRTWLVSLAPGGRRGRPSGAWAIVVLTWWRPGCRMVRGHVWPSTPADTTWMLFALWCGANADCRTHSRWVTWSPRPPPYITLAAQFKTPCSLSQSHRLERVVPTHVLSNCFCDSSETWNTIPFKKM